jgi:hypothetical protein
MATANCSPVSFQRNRVSAVTTTLPKTEVAAGYFDGASHSEIRSWFADNSARRESIQDAEQIDKLGGGLPVLRGWDTRGSHSRAWARARASRCTPIT